MKSQYQTPEVFELGKAEKLTFGGPTGNTLESCACRRNCTCGGDNTRKGKNGGN